MPLSASSWRRRAEEEQQHAAEQPQLEQQENEPLGDLLLHEFQIRTSKLAYLGQKFFICISCKNGDAQIKVT